MQLVKVVAISVLSMAVAAPARAADPAVPHQFTSGTAAKAAEVNENFAYLAARPRVFVKRACATDCNLTATTSDRDHRGDNWIPLASLSLPGGNWLVTAKLTFWNGYGDGYVLDCDLRDASGTQTEGASVAYGASSASPLHLQGPLSWQLPLKLDAASTVSVRCRPVGKSVTTADLTTLRVWGVMLTAVEVASITVQ